MERRVSPSFGWVSAYLFGRRRTMKRQKGANNVNQSTRQRHEDMKKIKTDVLSLCFPSILTNKGATSNGMSALTSFGASQNLLPTRPLKSSTSRSVGYRFTRRVSLPSSCSSIYTRFGVRRLARIYYGTRSVSYLGCSSVFGQHRVVCVGHSSDLANSVPYV